jgi:hypothetical protein
MLASVDRDPCAGAAPLPRTNEERRAMPGTRILRTKSSRRLLRYHRHLREGQIAHHPNLGTRFAAHRRIFAKSHIGGECDEIPLPMEASRFP